MNKIYIARREEDIPENIRKELQHENGSYFIEDTKENRIKYSDIVPIGFSGKKIDLNIDLIPRTSWGASLANSLTTESWLSIRKPFIAKHGNRCQICGRKGQSLSKTIQDVDTHEIWEYSDLRESNKKQTLVGFLALCSSCHLMYHLGYASTINKSEITMQRIKRLEKISDQEVRRKIDGIYSVWKKRSNYDWEIDISMLRKYGFNNLKFKKTEKKTNIIY